MNKSLSLIISSVFHPVFVNLMGLLSLFVLSPYLRLGVNENAKLFYILFIFISAGIVPVVMVLLLNMLGKVQSVLLDVQEERNIPYLITASIYLIDYYFLSQSQQTPTLIRAYVLACACIVVAVVIVNHFYKCAWSIFGRFNRCCNKHKFFLNNRYSLFVGGSLYHIGNNFISSFVFIRTYTWTSNYRLATWVCSNIYYTLNNYFLNIYTIIKYDNANNIRNNFI